MREKLQKERDSRKKKIGAWQQSVNESGNNNEPRTRSEEEGNSKDGTMNNAIDRKRNAGKRKQEERQKQQEHELLRSLREEDRL